MTDDTFIKTIQASIAQCEHEPLTQQEIDEFDRVIQKSCSELKSDLDSNQKIRKDFLFGNRDKWSEL